MSTKMKSLFGQAKGLLMAGTVLAFVAFFAPATATAQKVVTDPEVLPEYPGGMQAMMTYLGNNITYPEAARKKNVEGMSVVTFIIEKDGQVSNVSLKKGFDKDCDAEAMRVVKAMPAWTPGKKGGKKVRTEYNLPIKFKLN
jgi:protein TonB